MIQLINDTAADIIMIDDLHVYIIMVSSELDRFPSQRGGQEGNPTIPEVGGQTKPTPKLCPKEDE